MDQKILFKYGFHIGGRLSLWRPLLNNYLGGVRHKVFLFDLNKTQMIISKAFSFLTKTWHQGNTFLFVEKSNIEKNFNLMTKQAHPIFFQRFFFLNRWVGGFFTNFFTLFPHIVAKLKKPQVFVSEKRLAFQLLNSFPKYNRIRKFFTSKSGAS